MAIGVVAEYNPFHNGHLYHVKESRQQCGDRPVVAVMSGNFVQRGSFAVADKFVRAAAAVRSGVVDLVLELPTPYAVSSAEGFARAGVAILAATGVVTTLSFGSECGDVAALSEVAAYLNTSEFDADVRERLCSGVSYATARQQAAEGALGSVAALLGSPNNTLAVEYLRAIETQGCGMSPITVRRVACAHDAPPSPQMSEAHIDIASASYIRELVCSEGVEAAARYVQGASFETFCRAVETRDAPPSCALADALQMGALRRLTARDYAAISDVSEGLEHRVFAAVSRSATVEEAAAAARSKRYPLSRIRRILLRAALGITAELDAIPPPYIRVLAMSDAGRALLRRMKKRAALPQITKPANANLAGDAARVFAAETLAVDFYNLAKPQPSRRCAGANHRVSPVHVVL